MEHKRDMTEPQNQAFWDAVSTPVPDSPRPIVPDSPAPVPAPVPGAPKAHRAEPTPVPSTAPVAASENHTRFQGVKERLKRWLVRLDRFNNFMDGLFPATPPEKLKSLSFWSSVGRSLAPRWDKICQLVIHHKGKAVTLGLVGILALAAWANAAARDDRARLAAAEPGYAGERLVSQTQMGRLTPADFKPAEIMTALAFLKNRWPAHITSPWKNPAGQQADAPMKSSAGEMYQGIMLVRKELIEETGFSLLAQGINTPLIGKILTDMMHVAHAVYHKVGDRPVPLAAYFENGYMRSTAPMMGDDLSIGFRRAQASYYLTELEKEENHDRRNQINDNKRARAYQTGQGR